MALRQTRAPKCSDPSEYLSSWHARRKREHRVHQTTPSGLQESRKLSQPSSSSLTYIALGPTRRRTKTPISAKQGVILAGSLPLFLTSNALTLAGSRLDCRCKRFVAASIGAASLYDCFNTPPPLCCNLIGHRQTVGPGVFCPLNMS